MDLLLLGPGGIGAQKPVKNEESFAMLHRHCVQVHTSVWLLPAAGELTSSAILVLECIPIRA